MENKYYPHLFQKGTVGGVVREFDTFPNEKTAYKPHEMLIFFCQICCFYI